MPIKEGTLLACKDGVVELTLEIVDPERDDVDTLIALVRERIAEHQSDVMSDPAILNPAHLLVASCIVSRDPLPAQLHEALVGLGFEPAGVEGGGADEHSIFARFQKGRRSKLDQWRSLFLRAADVSERLAELEESLIDEVPEGPFHEIAGEGSRAVMDAARTAFGLLLAPGLEGLRAVEEQLLKERGGRKGRLVLHSAAARGLACFAGESIRHAAPDTGWSDDPEEGSPLHVRARGGVIVRTDPLVRVASFVIQGRRALLSDYAQAVLSQSKAGR